MNWRRSLVGAVLISLLICVTSHFGIISKNDINDYKRHKWHVDPYSTELMDLMSHFLHAGRKMVTPEQCRAARGLLGWSQGELAEKAAVGIVTVRHLEGGYPRSSDEPRWT